MEAGTITGGGGALLHALSHAGMHLARCPRCIPADALTKAAKAKVTDLAIAIKTGEALFRCVRCGFTRRVAVGKQPTPSTPTDAKR
jgi:uncharacterized C2H2 Zn-finger protein